MKKIKKPLIFKGVLSTSNGQGENLSFMVEVQKYSGYDNWIDDSDYLIIFDPKDKRKTIWKGLIYFRYKVVQSALAGFGCDFPYPKGIKISVWTKYIKEKYPAKLIKGEKPTEKKK